MGLPADVALPVDCGCEAGLEFRILGPLEVVDGGRALPVPGAKERALLADLLVNAGRVVAADRLIEDLWGDRPPGNPANTLQGRVSALRRSLGPAGADLLRTAAPGYRLAAPPESVDATRFQRLVAEAERPGVDVGRAVGLLEEALGLWRGPALGEFADRPWAQVEAARLEELRLGAEEALADLRLAAGGHAELVGELEALVAAQPLRERRRGQLMLALYRAGRQADALRVHAETRATLAEELGIDPGPQLQRLHRAILDQDPALLPPAPQVVAPALPERLTSLVGWDRELAEVAKLVGQHRMVTVTGAGGAGKTSLAVEVARRLADRFPDGVWLVELAALADGDLVGEAVASALGLREEPGDEATPLPQRLSAALRDRRLLLVLDNCEHLTAACAGLATHLLRSTRTLRLLTTSREPLGTPGELLWPVPPLAAPDDPGDPEALLAFDAVRLFVERARLADPGFVLDGGNAAAVAELCRRLDGLPLAIELAAARVRALPPAELAARLGDRFALLTAPGRAQDPRQQTLRATVDWSHQLLEEADRRLFRRLGVFSGTWTLAAAEAVTDTEDVAGGLVRLVDRSLVVALGGDPARYRLLETLRAYAAERLDEVGETAATTARHTAFFTALAERAASHRTAHPWLHAVAADYDNLRAVLDRAAADRRTALRVASALGWYWLEHHRDEGRQRLAAAVALAEGHPPSLDLARTLLAKGLVEIDRGATLPEVLAVARPALALFTQIGDPVGAATAKILVATAEHQHHGPNDESPRLVAEARAAFAQAGDRWGEAYGRLAAVSVDPAVRGAPGRAEAFAQEALAGFAALDDRWGSALALYQLSNLAKARGEVALAVDRYEQAIAAAREDGPLWLLCGALIELAGLLALEGDAGRADALHAEAAAIVRRAGWGRGLSYISNAQGTIARARGDLERARRLHADALAIVRQILGWSVPYTLALLGTAEARLDALDDADRHLREAAQLVLAAPEPPTAALVLVGHAFVALGRDRPDRAATLLAAAAATRAAAGITPVGAERIEADLAATAARTSLDPSTWARAEAAGQALTTADALRLACS